MNIPIVSSNDSDDDDSDSDDSYSPNSPKKKQHTHTSSLFTRQPQRKLALVEEEDQSSTIPFSGKRRLTRQRAGKLGLDSHQPSVSLPDTFASDEAQPSTSTGRGEKTFKCSICEYCSDSKSQFSYHMNTHTGKRPFKCKECFKSFSSPTNLCFHRKIHLPPEFKCDLCSKMFTYKQGRDVHMKTHTGAAETSSGDAPSRPTAKRKTSKGKEKIKCDYCDSTFNYRSQMTYHLNSHMGKRPFKCKDCSKAFFSQSALYTHRKMHSPPEYSCDFCPKMFNFKWNRDDHMKIHAGRTKPYSLRTSTGKGKKKLKSLNFVIFIRTFFRIQGEYDRGHLNAMNVQRHF